MHLHSLFFIPFYSADYFSDYPPGYIYILYPIGMLLELFGLEFMSEGSLFLITLPAVICDILTGIVIYRLAAKKSDRSAAAFSAAYLFNPAVIQNSSVWGQVDSVYTLAAVLMCIFLYEKKPVQSYFVFAAGILIKPQMLIFTPLLLWGIYENVFAGGFDKSKFIKNLLCGLSAVGCMAIACLPFGITKVIRQYLSTLDSYPYVSVNAYNFWSLLGLNWTHQDEPFIGQITYKQIGTLVIPAICIFAAVILFKRKGFSDRYWTAGAFIISAMFIFSIRMHERYLYPVMVFLLLAYLENKDKRFMVSYILMSVLMYLNVWHVLKYYNSVIYGDPGIIIQLISLGMLQSGIFLYRSIFRPFNNDISFS